MDEIGFNHNGQWQKGCLLMTRRELALHGGKPIRNHFLPFHQPLLGKEEEQEVIDTLRSGWITRGPKTEKFEEEFGKYVGAKFAIGLNSCTAALHLALVVAGISKGDEIITTSVTFPATVNVIVHQGAIPIFVDVEPDTLNIDAERIEEKITTKTKAIIVVHMAGHPCEMDKVLEIARRHNLIVIEDAAHAIEAVYKGKKIGSISDLTAFSFYATKNVTTGEGGMLVTDNQELAEKARVLSLHGISKDAWKRYSDEGYQHWEVMCAGYKYNMFDIQASLGLHQLAKIEKFWEVRREYVKMYNEVFSAVPEVIALAERSYVKHAYHLYVIVVKTENMRANRDVIMNAIQAENIGVGIHFRALHLQPYYRKTLGLKKGFLPNAEYASDRILSLPLYPKITRRDIQDVIGAVKKVIQYYRV